MSPRDGTLQPGRVPPATLMTPLRPSAGAGQTGAPRFRLGLAGFAAVLGLLLLAGYAPVLLGGQSFVYRDFGLFGHPLAHHLRESVRAGELPLWNPHSNCGLPFLAQWNTLALYPPSLLYILLPLPWSLNLFCLLHLFLGGLGMHALVRRWTGRDLPGALAGTAYAFQGVVVGALMWPNNIAAMGLMPWVLGALVAAWQQGGRAAVVAALLGALQMLTGAPEIIVFTWLLAGVVWLADWPGAGARLRHAVRFGGVGLGVAALSAAQLLPFLQLLAESHRGTTFGDAQWSMPPWGWANLLVPRFRLDESISGVTYQGSQAWTSSYYLGLATVALALAAAVVGGWTRRVVWLAVFTLGGLLLALGDATPVYSFFREAFPFLGFMRFPIKYVTCAALALPLLAGLGAATVEAAPDAARRHLATLAGVLGVACAGLVAAAQAWPWPGQETGTVLVSALTRVGLLVAALAAVLLHARSAPGARRLGLALAAVGVLWLDARTHVPPQNPMVDSAVYAPGLLQTEAMNPRPTLGAGRAALSFDSLNAFATNRLANQAQSFLLMRLWQFQNLNLPEQLPKVDGFFSLYLERERQLHFRLYGSDGLPRPGLADFLGISQVNVPAEGGSFRWAHRPTSLPWLTLPTTVAFAEGEALLANLMAPSWNPRQTVFLPPGTKVPAPGAATVRSQRVGAHRIEAEVEAAGPALLVIAQAAYPAWAAYVDGRKVDILRANHAYQAVPVPAGRHLVELRYEDRWFQAGLGVSGLTLATCAFLAWRWRRAGRTDG